MADTTVNASGLERATSALEWARSGPHEQRAVHPNAALIVAAVFAVDRRTGRKRCLGWDGFRNGLRINRWLTEEAAKRAMERRAVKGGWRLLSGRGRAP